ncbi:superoxide dismutase [Mycobacterium intermedium]|uniref:Superoxide dismutase n=1 Tax=Mycobacterium intermedium TaxID=28445 RepID=A0A1E3SKW9_MYCIE|nr:superoxide dismutase family protein [Mycobacterium intermedium]MCV6963418.1 superoxide dismutase family protein [Mycobacterium intermedium]ODR02814.1 superoxide dismutase [Mycobacterium intermedium]OPE47653.1 superoxide dismutase [Mycobacterium intermedium]ORA98669.1 superoxide dismutase [Mycobacterium intermedium]
MKMGVSVAVAAVAVAAAPIAACGNQQGGGQATSASTKAPGTERMTTPLKAADGSQVATATFDFANGYVTVTVDADPNQVLTPGFHGLQIHSVGKCEGADFEAAGSVFQKPDHTGYPASGELTALQVRSDGSAKLVTTTDKLTAADLRSSSGTALIIHQNADNLSGSPSDEPNRHVACGVIAAASATTTSSTTTTTSVTTSTTTTEVPPPSTSTSTSTVTVTSTPTLTTSMPMPTPTITLTPTPTVSLPPGT